MQSFRNFLKENEKKNDNFSKMEGNPFIWLLVIPRLLKLGKEEAKKDEILKNAIKVTEKAMKDVPKKGLEELKEVKPFPVMDLFKMSNNYKVLFANYFSDFKKVVCNSTDSFTKALELDGKLDELYNSPEYEVFKNNI